MNIYSLRANMEENEIVLLSIMDPATDKENTLTDKTIVGYLKEKDLPVTWDNIIFNPKFIDHFHKTIVFFSQYSDQVIQLSEHKKAGFVYVLDKRNGDTDNPSQEDIIGSFEVQHGRVVSESYEPNPAYQLISNKGPFVLQPELEALLYNTAY